MNNAKATLLKEYEEVTISLHHVNQCMHCMNHTWGNTDPVRDALETLRKELQTTQDRIRPLLTSNESEST